MVVTVLSYVCISYYTRTHTKGLKYESTIGLGAFKTIIFITLLFVRFRLPSIGRHL